MKTFITVTTISLLTLALNAQVSNRIRRPEPNNTIRPLPEKVASVTDIDGNSYPVITIGSQTWFGADLKTTKLNDGTNITCRIGGNDFSSDQPAYCYLRDNLELGLKFGFLYNFATVSTNKVCPAGWHVPSDADWAELEKYLVTNGFSFAGNPGGTGIAKALAATEYWYPTNQYGTPGNQDFPDKRNATGFTALPASRRGGTGWYDAPNQSVYWWSSTPNYSNGVWIRFIIYNRDMLNRESRSPYDAMSIRCIKD